MASWFGSHPNTNNRVKRLKQMGEEIKAGRIPVDGDDKDEEKEMKRSGK